MYWQGLQSPLSNRCKLVSLSTARSGLPGFVSFMHFTNGVFASLHICLQYMLMMTASNLYHNTTSSVWTWRNAPHYFHFCTSCFNILISSWHSLNIVLNNLMSYVWQINSIEYVASLLIVFLGVKSFALATHSRPSWLRQALTLQFWGGLYVCFLFTPYNVTVNLLRGVMSSTRIAAAISTTIESCLTEMY